MDQLKEGLSAKKVLSFVLLNIAVFLVYFLAGKFGLKLAFIHVSASPVWPPTGIAIAAALIFGYRVWPALLVGAFLFNFATTGDLDTSIAIGIGNMLEGIAGAYLTNKFANGKKAFDLSNNIFKFLFFAAIPATIISATIGVTSLTVTGLADWAKYLPIWLTWWLGDLMGALIVTPLILLWTNDPKLHWKGWKIVEGIIYFVLLVFVCLTIFGGFFSFSKQHYAIAFTTIPFLLWAAFRFGKKETATAVTILAGIALWGTIKGSGPFYTLDENVSLLLLQSFLGVMGVTKITIAAVVSESKRKSDELRTTYEELKKVDVLKDKFITYTSHELKTPITPIIIQAQLLLEGSLGKISSKQKTAVDSILRNIKRLNGLLSDILDFSVIQTEKKDVDINEAKMSDVIKEIIEYMKPVAVHKKIKLSAKIGEIPNSMFDARRIGQVLTNLIDNAIKFTPEKGEVIVEAEKQDGDIIVKVKDTGIGISQEDIEKLFKPFSQITPSYKLGQRGTGLGLAICKGIIELHGGKMHVESTVGKGSTFSFSIPFKAP